MATTKLQVRKEQCNTLILSQHAMKDITFKESSYIMLQLPSNDEYNKRIFRQRNQHRANKRTTTTTKTKTTKTTLLSIHRQFIISVFLVLLYINSCRNINNTNNVSAVVGAFNLFRPNIFRWNHCNTKSHSEQTHRMILLLSGAVGGDGGGGEDPPDSIMPDIGNSDTATATVDSVETATSVVDVQSPTPSTSLNDDNSDSLDAATHSILSQNALEVPPRVDEQLHANNSTLQSANKKEIVVDSSMLTFSSSSSSSTSSSDGEFISRRNWFKVMAVGGTAALGGVAYKKWEDSTRNNLLPKTTTKVIQKPPPIPGSQSPGVSITNPVDTSHTLPTVSTTTTTKTTKATTTAKTATVTTKTTTKPAPKGSTTTATTPKGSATKTKTTSSTPSTKTTTATTTTTSIKVAPKSPTGSLAAPKTTTSVTTTTTKKTMTAPPLPAKEPAILEPVNLTQVAQETKVNVTLNCQSGCISVDDKNFTKVKTAKKSKLTWPTWIPILGQQSKPQIIKVIPNSELLLAAVVAGTATEMFRTSVLYPIQTVKSRIQTGVSEDHHHHNHDDLNETDSTLLNETLLIQYPAPPPQLIFKSKILQFKESLKNAIEQGDLYAGIAPTLLVSAPATGVYYGARDITKRGLLALPLTSTLDPVAMSVIAALIADVCSLMFRTPADALSARLQTKNVNETNSEMGDWLGDSVKRLPAIIATDLPYLLSKIAISGILLQTSPSNSIDRYTEIAVVSSAICALATTPFDVARTRLLVNVTESQTQSGVIKTMYDISKEGTGGITNLFAGWFNRVAYLAIGRAWLEPIQIIGYIGIRDAVLLEWFD